jgi:hypothetical protein
MEFLYSGWFLLFCLLILVFFVLWLLRKKPFASFVCSVFILLGIGLTLLSARVPYLRFSFAESLGHAFIVAAILSLTVDYYLKNRVLREVSADVSKYLIGYQLPLEIQDRIKALMRTQWTRRNCHVHCRVSDIPGRASYVKLDVTIADEMENITDQTQYFTDTLEYEKHDPERITELRCDSDDKNANYCLGGDVLAKEKRDEPGVMVVHGKRVKIPPASERRHKYRFTAKYEVVYPENYSDVVVFTLPTIGVVLEVECPNNLRFTASPADMETPNRWEYKRLFLSGDHVRFRWERAQTSPSPKTPR